MTLFTLAYWGNPQSSWDPTRRLVIYWTTDRPTIPTGQRLSWYTCASHAVVTLPNTDLTLRVGYGGLFALMNYGRRWRQHRRAVHPTLTPDVIQQYQPIQTRVARNFVQNILCSPEDLAFHIRL